MGTSDGTLPGAITSRITSTVFLPGRAVTVCAIGNVYGGSPSNLMFPMSHFPLLLRLSRPVACRAAFVFACAVPVARSSTAIRHSWLTREPWPRRSTSCTSITSVAGAILVNAPTLGGWYLLQGQAVAISRTTGIYALLFSGLSRRKGGRGETGVTRIECSRTQSAVKKISRYLVR